ncbi:hypothetical protein Bravens_00793 [Brevibacterium ravenspurgense]|uniref:Uncharacterized protein n=1 Tax=Brevibacterium ravenspurgense TaxID=479117 RepID=A0A150HA49_9MICO|nr:hypothetical protein [Brevibacterium ravenspurgense]KXZ58921.1 hypothetical protein Bravens_00793 [Brevibacterium ravenspurgense]
MNSHSSSQMRGPQETARGAQNAAPTREAAVDGAHGGAEVGAGVDTRNVRRALGVGVLFFGLATIVTFVFALFTALTWAVPVLSAAMALSCVLVVIAINGEASEGAVARRSAPVASSAAPVAAAPAAKAAEPAPAAKAHAAKSEPAAPAATAEAPSVKVTPQVPAQKGQTSGTSSVSKLMSNRSGAARETRAERVRRLAASSMRRNDVPSREVLDLEAPTGEIPVVSTGEKRVREVVASSEFAPRPVPEPTYVKVARAAGESAAQDGAAVSAAERESAAEHFAAAEGTVPELVDAAKEDDGTAALKHGRKAIRADKQVAKPGAVSRAAEDAAYEKVNDLLARRRA